MKITFDWIKDYLNTNLKEQDLLEQLTNIGLEVESVENLSADNQLFKVAKIVKTEKGGKAVRRKKKIGIQIKGFGKARRG